MTSLKVIRPCIMAAGPQVWLKFMDIAERNLQLNRRENSEQIRG